MNVCKGGGFGITHPRVFLSGGFLKVFHLFNPNGFIPAAGF
jgi:hypothetical protein